MNPLLILISFCFGSIIGSFLNVVALRYGTARSLGGRSGCMSCGSPLKALDLVPIVSWLFLRGRCRVCKSAISPQYPLVEFFTGLVFALLAWKYVSFIDYSTFSFMMLFGFSALVFCILMVIVVYDMRHKIIPDGLVYTFIALSFVRLLIDWSPRGILSAPGIYDLLAGPLLALPFALLWFFSRGKWIGFGDAKLALGIGWFVGYIGGPSAIALGFWIGAVVSVGLLMWSKVTQKGIVIDRHTEIPFAPFLIIGLALVFFLQIDLFYMKEILAYGL